MTRRDWLLLLLAEHPGGDGLDPIRIQKALFLFAQEGDLPAGERYWFVPYNYGPMSPQVYRDVEELVRGGLLERRSVDGHRWRRVRATEAGRAWARGLRSVMGDRELEAVDLLRAIRESVGRLGFTALLDSVYDRYPRYARRSVFRRRP
jgi:uncharacterized protein YwgA